MPDTETEVEYRAELHAVITRADGTVEDLGCIASTEDGTVQLTRGPEPEGSDQPSQP